MSVFVDTSALLAILDADDPRHRNASVIWTEIIESDEEIVTSNYVALETFSLLHRRFGAAAASRFSDDMAPAVAIHWVDQSTHDTANSAALASAGKGGPSLVDCVSFDLIRRLNVDRVFAYDKHFRGRGYQLIG